MQQFYASMQIFQPNLESYCMIDIGGEAIELGVVRDGLLEHATSTTNGHYALARKYTSATNGSFSDILQSIQHDHAEYVASLSAEKKSTVTAIFDLTVESLVELFRHTGDSLSIPKTIFLHTDSGFESFGSELVAIASKQATKVEHTIKNITTELFAEEAKNETKILLSCYVFHIANKNGARKS